MPEPAVLELSVHKIGARRYSTVLRFRDAEENVDKMEAGEFVLDHEALLQNEVDDDSYGRLLTDALIKDKIGECFGETRSATEALERPVSFRLFIDDSASELHALGWERMVDPDPEGGKLAMHPRLRFSRYLTSRDWRPIRTGRRPTLRHLVVIANPDGPDGLARYRMAPVDVAAHRAQVADVFPDENTTYLIGRDATLDRLAEHLRKGIDVLYLVCHGVVEPASLRPYLYLDDGEGNVARADGTKLAETVEDLEERPRLVFLVSCESGLPAAPPSEGSSPIDNSVGALGPRLAKAGVPAIVAMHGQLSQEAALAFVPEFFRSLKDEVEDGRVDRAMALARSKLREDPDWWKPVLFTRLATGQLWYSKGMHQFEKWNALLDEIKRGDCTPIIGPGVAEHILGNRRDVAIRWAKKERFPLSPNSQDDMAQVAQYVAVRETPRYIRNQLHDFVKDALLTRYGDLLSEAVREKLSRATAPSEKAVADAVERSTVDERIAMIGRRLMSADPSDASRVLAELHLPVYVVANYSSLMEEALDLAGTPPHVHHYRWKEENEDYWRRSSDEDPQESPKAPGDGSLEADRKASDLRWRESDLATLQGAAGSIDEAWKPTPEEPLVCRLFGTLRETESLVLTEDDYLDYLIGLGRDQDEASQNTWGIPPAVRRRFKSSSLLFLGFTMDDWVFRVLLRSILQKEGQLERKEFPHVAVQLDPEEGHTIDRDRAKKYLETYFGTESIGLYWGNVHDFTNDLRARR